MVRPRALPILLVAGLTAACAAGVTPTTEPPTTTTASDAGLFPDPGAKVEHVELHAVDDTRMVLAYTTRTSEGHRLWVSVIENGSPSEPVQVADQVTDVPLSEFRPSVAVSADEIAVAWTSLDSDVFVALSGDGGETFHAPFRLNLEARGMQILPAITYDTSGTLHAVWIDPRDPDAEEPADLHLGILSGEQYLESNITELSTPSVCGCCLPHIEEVDGHIRITFRNTTEDGYRDPFQIVPDGESEPVAPPTWQIEACPIAGPVVVGDRVMWYDGSTGQARILLSNGPETAPDVVLDSGDGFRVTAGPRLVTGGDPMILVPATPTPRLLAPDGSPVDVKLPSWATVGAVHGGALVIAGSDNGNLRH